MKQDPFAGLPQTVSSEPTEAIPDVLEHKPSTAQRDRDWEKAQRKSGDVVTYRGVPKHLQQEISRAANKHHVPVGEVARMFLEYALVAYERGELPLTAHFGPGKLTLYPGN
jgi:hypothetical protein